MGSDRADLPTAQERSERVMPASEDRKIPHRSELEVMPRIEVGTGLVQYRIARLKLLAANIVRGGINGVAPSVRAREADSAAELVSNAGNQRVIAGVYVRKREKDSTETVVPNRHRRGTRRIG